MSRDFEVVYEAPLRTEDFGEGTSAFCPLLRQLVTPQRFELTTLSFP
jgi:hypothetical protein